MTHPPETIPWLNKGEMGGDGSFRRCPRYGFYFLSGFLCDFLYVFFGDFFGDFVGDFVGDLWREFRGDFRETVRFRGVRFRGVRFRCFLESWINWISGEKGVRVRTIGAEGEGGSPIKETCLSREAGAVFRRTFGRTFRRMGISRV